MPAPRPLPFPIGRFACHTYLGGNLSEVYRAADTESGFDVAVKLIQPGAGESDTFRQRFLSEMQIAARVAHPGVVGLHTSGEENGIFYMALELLQGETLDSYLRRGALQRQDEAIGFAWQIACALSHVHDLGIIHRDLKPENISVEPGGRIKLFDFGVARVDNLNLTRAGEQVGTPLYMSPEQVRGKPVTRGADIYSFGVLLFLMLTGTFPYRAGTREELFAAIVTRPVELEPLHVANAPGQVATTVARCLEKNLVLRPRNFHEIANALRPYAPLEMVASLGIPHPAPQAKDPSWLKTPVEIPIPDPKTLPLPPSVVTAASARTSPFAVTRPMSVSPAPAAAPANSPFAPLPAGDEASVKSNRKLPALGLLFSIGAAVFFLGGGAFILRYLQSSNKPISSMIPALPGSSGSSTQPVKPDMVLIPAGRALLGKDRQPVDVGAFYIDKTEVTNRDFLRFCKQTGRSCPPGVQSAEPDHPVVNVTYDDAQEFANWTGRRLPTAAEWQKAARGDRGDEFPWGNQPRLNLANIGGGARRHLVAVTEFSAGASPYGALNMVGNAWEWVDAKEELAEVDFDRLKNRFTPPLDRSEPAYQIRGGSFQHNVTIESLSSVIWDFAVMPSRLRREDIGFRCAKDATP